MKQPTEGEKSLSTNKRITANINLALVYNLAPDGEMSTLINEWLDSCRANGLSLKTIDGYERNVNKFLWWWDQRKDTGKAGNHPRLMTTAHARDYAVYLRTPTAFRWGEEVLIRRGWDSKFFQLVGERRPHREISIQQKRQVYPAHRQVLRSYLKSFIFIRLVGRDIGYQPLPVSYFLNFSINVPNVKHHSINT